MHILIVTAWYPDNVSDVTATFVRDQCLALSRTGGHKVGVLFPYFSKGGEDSQISRACCKRDCSVESGILTVRMALPRFLSRVPVLSARTWVFAGKRLFASYVRDHGRPDIVYAHVMFYAGLLAYRLWVKQHIPYVIVEHNSGYARGFVKNWQLTLGRRAALAARSRIAVGTRFSHLLDSVYSMPEGSWRYVPNVVSNEFFRRDLARPQERMEQDFIFCTVSNLNMNKGVDLIIRAFTRAFAGRAGCRLVIAGDGTERAALIRLAAELNVNRVVQFRGQISRIAVIDLISRSHALVLGSYYETFGVVIAEAHALGRPVIATRSGGPEDLVTSRNGILVETGNIDEMASAFVRIRETYGTFESAAIRDECKRRFSEPVVVRQLEELFGGDHA